MRQKKFQETSQTAPPVSQQVQPAAGYTAALCCLPLAIILAIIAAFLLLRRKKNGYHVH